MSEASSVLVVTKRALYNQLRSQVTRSGMSAVLRLAELLSN